MVSNCCQLLSAVFRVVCAWLVNTHGVTTVYDHMWHFSPHQGCWCLGAARHQGISSHTQDWLAQMVSDDTWCHEDSIFLMVMFSRCVLNSCLYSFLLNFCELGILSTCCEFGNTLQLNIISGNGFMAEVCFVLNDVNKKKYSKSCLLSFLIT